jgi:hypothetical protein
MQGLLKEAKVLEEKKQTKIGKQAEPQIVFPMPLIIRLFHFDGGTVIDQRREYNQEEIRGIPAHIEVVAGHQQEAPSVSLRDQKISDHHKGKENQKMKRVK